MNKLMLFDKFEYNYLILIEDIVYDMRFYEKYFVFDVAKYQIFF